MSKKEDYINSMEKTQYEFLERICIQLGDDGQLSHKNIEAAFKYLYKTVRDDVLRIENIEK